MMMHNVTTTRKNKITSNSNIWDFSGSLHLRRAEPRPPPACRLEAEMIRWRHLDAAFPLFSLISFSPWRSSLPRPPPSSPAAPPWPPARAAAAHLPDLLRARPQHRLAFLILLARGIAPRSPEEPPQSPIFPAVIELAATEFAAVRPPPAPSTSPASSS
jgi:hypothetical protein